MLKNSNIISEVLELSSDEVDKITTNTELSDFNWDSLAMVNLITHISENFNVEIEFDSFDNILNFDGTKLILHNIIKHPVSLKT